MILSEHISDKMNKSELYKLNKDELILLIAEIQDMKEKQDNKIIRGLIPYLNNKIWRKYNCKVCEAFYLKFQSGEETLEHYQGCKENWGYCFNCVDFYCEKHIYLIEHNCIKCENICDINFCENCRKARTLLCNDCNSYE